MDARKRPRHSTELGAADSAPASSPTIALLQTQIATLQTQLSHAQSMRSLERKSFTLNEERLKRQIADAHTEMEQQRGINEGMKLEMEQMEDQMSRWVERARGAEEGALVSQGHQDGMSELEREKCTLMQQRLSATTQQVDELTRLLQEAQEKVAAAEVKASQAELKLSQLQFDKVDAARTVCVNDENCNPQILRATRIQLAEAERGNRELTRQNNDMKIRLKDMLQLKGMEESAQRKILHLEEEVQQLQRQVESGEEVERKWMAIRREIVEEGLVNDGVDENAMNSAELYSSILTVGAPPEIATMVRKFQGLKHNAKKLKEETVRLAIVSDERSRHCAELEKQLNEKCNSISTLENEVKATKETMKQLELENRKIVAQQVIWKRESEGMRSLLDTYEIQETIAAQSKESSKSKSASTSTGKTETPDEASPTVKGLQISLKSAQEECKLLTETNHRLENELNSLKTQQQASQTEHERVLEKFAKLRSALMDERSKAQSAEERACKAETLAGKGSYNSDTTRVLHLESNPLSNAIKQKFQAELDSLKQRLEQAEQISADSSSPTLGTTTPARRSFGSSDASLDAQKLHKRLKERFKEQIGLFREGVYLLTGCKIDMSFSDSDCPHFKVRSMYSEREEDHLMFKWRRKKGVEDNDLDLMSTDLAQLLMNDASAIYMTKFRSVPAFMASVTLGLFEKQTMI